MSNFPSHNTIISVFWFRRDLRLDDNQGLAKAMESGLPVLPIFIFDTNIIDELQEDDPRITFIYESLNKIHEELRSRNSAIHIYKGDPLLIWKELVENYQISSVFVNKDYEPYAISRDKEIENFLSGQGIPLYSYKDQVIFEELEILKKDGNPYTVFTPYKKKWLEHFQKEGELQIPKITKGEFVSSEAFFPEIQALGFRRSRIRVTPYDLSVIKDYPLKRDIPAANATSHVSPHLRFGTIGIRTLIQSLKPSDEIYLSELIWREFFMQILFNFPHVELENFSPKYNWIEWRQNEADFNRWCKGETGYPMVDAGMRQLNVSGTMHNRVRMITAGFLCKHLLIDWRWGEAYFAEKLLDYELSSNNGNWQWAAGTGCDAAPYFRVFNPTTQMNKFDKNCDYIRKWVHEYGTSDYPPPMVDHSFARERAIDTYKKGIRISLQN